MNWFSRRSFNPFLIFPFIFFESNVLGVCVCVWTLFLHLETQNVNDKIIKKRMLYALLFNYYWSLNMIGCFYFLFIITPLYYIQKLVPQLDSGKKVSVFITIHMMILLHISIIIVHTHTQTYTSLKKKKKINIVRVSPASKGESNKNTKAFTNTFIPYETHSGTHIFNSHTHIIFHVDCCPILLDKRRNMTSIVL